MGLSTNAMAVHNLELPAELVFASKIDTVSDGSLSDSGAADIFDINHASTVLSANAVPGGYDVRITVTLGNSATFNGEPSVNAITDTASTPFDQPFPILTGGADSTSVVFMGTSGGGFDKDTQFVVNIPDITVANQNDTTISVTVQIADNFGITDLNAWSNIPYIAFADSLVTAFAADPDTQQIDVTQSNYFFDDSGTPGDVQTPLGTVSLNFNPLLGANGVDITNADAILTDCTVTITHPNNWDAFDAEADGVTVGSNNSTFNVNGTDTVYTPVNCVDFHGGLAVVGNVNAANAVAMNEGQLTATLTANAEGGYTATTATGNGSLSTLEKNGSSARLTQAMKPTSEGGAYSNYLRIVNPSEVGGTVNITLINDDGATTQPISLSDINGISSNILNAGASTIQFTIEDVYVAAVAADPAFTYDVNSNGKGKLRVLIEAEFGDNNDDTGVIINSYTASTDATTLFMLNNPSD